MTICARCRRHISHPVHLAGMTLGARCAAIVKGAPARRARITSGVRATPVDARQADLFSEARP